MSRSKGDHHACPPGTLINDRYKVIIEIGCGNFAKVYKCVDTKPADAATAPSVAVKVIKKEYAVDGSYERGVLKALGTYSSEGAEEQKRNGAVDKVVRAIDAFTWHKCPCFVFPLLGPCLSRCKAGVGKGHTDRASLHAFAREMLGALSYLHDVKHVIHTDLKPQNILVDEPTHTPESGIGHRGWTIADFGSASFYNPAKPDKDLIQTRPYRSPEVVLGLPWGPKADVFSMGCVIFEVGCGAKLFDGVNDDHAHMAAFEKKLGMALGQMPMARQSKRAREFFDTKTGKLLRAAVGITGVYADLAKPLRTALAEGLRVASPTSRAVAAAVAEDDAATSDARLLDLLQGMLHPDPAQRLSAAEALKHPYLLDDYAPRNANASSATLNAPGRGSAGKKKASPLRLEDALEYARGARPTVAVDPVSLRGTFDDVVDDDEAPTAAGFAQAAKAAAAALAAARAHHADVSLLNGAPPSVATPTKPRQLIPHVDPAAPVATKQCAATNTRLRPLSGRSTNSAGAIFPRGGASVAARGYVVGAGRMPSSGPTIGRVVDASLLGKVGLGAPLHRRPFSIM